MNDQYEIIQDGISIFDEEYDIGLDNDLGADIELGSLEDSLGDELENSKNFSDTDTEEQKSKSSLREQVIMEEEEIEDEEAEDEEVEDEEVEDAEAEDEEAEDKEVEDEEVKYEEVEDAEAEYEEVKDEEAEDAEAENAEAEEDCSLEELGGAASREGSGRRICIEDKEENESIVNISHINLSNE